MAKFEISSYGGIAFGFDARMAYMNEVTRSPEERALAVHDAACFVKRVAMRGAINLELIAPGGKSAYNAILSAFQLHPYFRNDHLHQSYDKALEKLTLQDTPERLLVIDDTEAGLEEAKRLGATVISVATYRHTYAFFNRDSGYAPDAIAENYSDVANKMGMNRVPALVDF